jgi:cell division septation protein DedD
MKCTMRTFSLALAASVVLTASCYAQVSERDIRTKLDAIYSGKADEIRAELPALLSRYPNDAGVWYVQAVLTADGAVAVKRYEEIAEKFPESVWADDALYKVYQYDFSMGLYKKADEVMERLRTAYPRSIYAGRGSASQPQTQESAAVVRKPDVAVVAPRKTDSAPEPKTQPGPTTVKAVEAGSSIYNVQAGLFSTEIHARRAAERYTGLSGREAHVKQMTSGEKTVYLVVFEGFATPESARRFSAELRTKYHIDSFVNPR